MLFTDVFFNNTAKPLKIMSASEKIKILTKIYIKLSLSVLMHKKQHILHKFIQIILQKIKNKVKLKFFY